MLSKGERIGIQNNNNSSDNKRSKIILREDVLYAYVTLKEIVIIIWEYMRGKYKNEDKRENP